MPSKLELLTLASQLTAAGGALGQNTGAGRLGRTLNQFQQSAIINESIKEQKRAEEEAKKSKLFGSIGQVLGTAAGIGLAPFTGGASLAATAALGAAGGGIGRVAGTAAGGGDVNFQTFGQGAIAGGVGGLSAGLLPPGAGGVSGVGRNAASQTAGGAALFGGSTIGQGLGSVSGASAFGSTFGAALPGAANATLGFNALQQGNFFAPQVTPNPNVPGRSQLQFSPIFQPQAQGLQQQFSGLFPPRRTQF